MRNVYINKISSFLPNQAINNDEIEDVLGYIGGVRSRAKSIVLRNNGIKQRYYVLDPKTRKPLFTNYEITANAIRGLLDNNLLLDDIECIACGTTLPDFIMPNHALMTQGELGVKKCEAIATSGICLSGVTAMKYAYMSIASSQHENAVCSGSEAVSLHTRAEMFGQKALDEGDVAAKPELAFGKDFLRWMLSDGAGAMLLAPQPNKDASSLKIEWIDIISYAGEMPPCMTAGAYRDESGDYKPFRHYEPLEWIEKNIFAIEQDVKLLNENIIEYTVSKPLEEIAKKRGLKPDDIDWFLPHYSSKYFKDKVADGLEKIGFAIPQEKWFTNLTSKGNTGSASIYIILDEIFNSDRLKKGEKIFCYVPESGRFSTAFILLEVV
jgi:3-oxoacyl-[acyl-carrier-protein] synthase III